MEYILSLKDKEAEEACFSPRLPRQARAIYEFLTYCMSDTTNMGGMDGGATGLSKMSLSTVAKEWGVSTKQYKHFIQFFENEMISSANRERKRQKDEMEKRKRQN